MINLLIVCFTIISTGISLSGKVTDPSGQPIKGAVVAISATIARPGTSVDRVTSFSACKKLTKTNADGFFQFEEIDDRLVFQLAVDAEGKQGKFTNYIDPNENSPVAITLEPFPGGDKYNIVTGTITDTAGIPLSNCRVTSHSEIRGIITSDRASGVTPVCFTNEKGNFRVAIEKEIDAAYFVFSLPGYSDVKLVWDRKNPRVLDHQMHRGSSLTGKLVRGETPLSNVVVGLVRKNRSSNLTSTPMGALADQDGKFRFDNLPADEEYVLYSCTDQDFDSALAPSLVKSAGDNQLADLGNVAAEAAQKLKIKISTSDGCVLPEGSLLGLYRGEILDYVGKRLAAAPSDEITFNGLSHGLFTFIFYTKGYKVSSTHPHTWIDWNRDREVFIEPGKDLELSVILEPISLTSDSKN